MATTIHAYTSAALNYIPKVRLLFNSVRQHHPEWKRYLLLADKLPPTFDSSQEPFDEIKPFEELGIDQCKGWSFCHTITELATAIKPWMLESLLEQSDDGDKVIYFDPDIVLFSPLDDILSALDEASVVLTPHQTSPEETLAAVIDNEICSLKHGVYNLGFIAVTNNPIGRAFARWWAERTYFFCRDDIPNGLFTDQRWIDLAPALFPNVAVMRSSRHNVSTWNITTRDLTKEGNNMYMVDGRPLGFYHFTGFDSGAHRIMASKNGNNNPALEELVTWYANHIQLLADDPLAKESWAYGQFDSGSPIVKEQRLVYRLRRDLQLKFPDPYKTDGFELWWEHQGRREYPQFFNKNAKQDVQNSMTGRPLCPGFLGTANSTMGRPSASSLLKSAFRDPKTGIELGRRAWEILQNEGLGGIKSRIS
jgi:hypothetical protein